MVDLILLAAILFLYACSLNDRAEIAKLRQEVNDAEERREGSVFPGDESSSN